jgi:hypothetical protein
LARFSIGVVLVKLSVEALATRLFSDLHSRDNEYLNDKYMSIPTRNTLQRLCRLLRLSDQQMRRQKYENKTPQGWNLVYRLNPFVTVRGARKQTLTEVRCGPTDQRLGVRSDANPTTTASKMPVRIGDALKFAHVPGLEPSGEQANPSKSHMWLGTEQVVAISRISAETSALSKYTIYFMQS